MIEWLNYWGQLLLLPLYACSRLFPRKAEIWLFGSTLGGRFADNPRYLFQYCVKHQKEYGIRPIWISHNREVVKYLQKHGYEAYEYHSLKGIYYALRGKVYLYDHYSKDINFWQSAGAIKVNLWHGIPLKKIQADNIHDKFRHPKNAWEWWKCLPRNISSEKPSDYIYTTSKALEPIFSSAFRNQHILNCGAYPRTDYLIAGEIRNLLLPREKKELELVKSFQKKYQAFSPKIVYYMPTFRESEEQFLEVMELGAFQKFLEKEHILFCMKLHPFSKLWEKVHSIVKKEFQNIVLMETASDPYVVLKRADILVTDYSSVYFDFLLLDRPIIFFDYDKEEYLTHSRELYYDYEEMAPGEKAETMEELMAALHMACDPSEDYQNVYRRQRAFVRDRMFDAPKELASPKLLKQLTAFIEQEKANEKTRKREETK